MMVAGLGYDGKIIHSERQIQTYRLSYANYAAAKRLPEGLGGDCGAVVLGPELR